MTDPLRTAAEAVARLARKLPPYEVTARQWDDALTTLDAALAALPTPMPPNPKLTREWLEYMATVEEGHEVSAGIGLFAPPGPSPVRNAQPWRKNPSCEHFVWLMTTN